MKTQITEISIKNNEEVSAKLIFKYLKEKKIIYIKSLYDTLNESLNPIDFDQPAVILNSSGSKNKPRKCLHAISNLNKSANASGLWLEEQDFILDNCIIFNTLPLNHISGFMALWRSKKWGCKYINISPKLIKQTEVLFKRTILSKKDNQKKFITSLVPTQLNRLISDKYGLKWLKLFDLVWVGGASISNETAYKCIKEEINLAPCYGTTETAAMVSTLKPKDFLKGNINAGEILKDVELRINTNGLIEIKSKRLGMELCNSKLKDFKNKKGWWESGDLGKLIKINQNNYLKINGRIDNAFNSGGETIFPEIIKRRLDDFIYKKNIPIYHIIISKVKDEYWGFRLEIIIFFENNIDNNSANEYIALLKEFSKNWARYEKPLRWIIQDKKSLINQELKSNWKNIN